MLEKGADIAEVKLMPDAEPTHAPAIQGSIYLSRS